MSALDYIREFNIVVAILALMMNLLKGYYLKLHRFMDTDSMMGFLGLMAWCLAYAVAASLAAMNDVEPGIWTIIMAIPPIWTLIAGLLGWDKRGGSRAGSTGVRTRRVR